MDSMQIIIAILIVLMTIILFLVRKKALRNSILLIGASDSGKTLLFTQLAYDSFVETVTSMKENKASIKLNNNRNYNLIDLPGNDRLRTQYWDQFKNQAKCLIFVIDSVAFLNNTHNVADLLYQYLCDQTVQMRKIPVIVACNKQDQTRAKSAKVIASIMEKEFNIIRETRLGALDSTVAGSDEKRLPILGEPDHQFSFNELRNRIEFVDCCASKEFKNLENIMKSINSV
ncbi:Signal recognition particle receptor subunit beta [Sarcoptes scabiei]|uniref:ADP-ribosylation factor-related protein 1 n=1 Tax=Sarcoptes scabiei TaxID=52283 RepID=A0A132A759_SARSC|nr:Signal recognition particle receptor subunit beta [Sarcoptes scabiei]KPM06798.1 signal recognition particle receptor subunit beta-like protein [Sarcoptes scabiei]